MKTPNMKAHVKLNFPVPLPDNPCATIGVSSLKLNGVDKIIFRRFI